MIALGRAWLTTSNIFVFYCLPNYNKLLCSLTHFICIYNLQRIQYKRRTNIACITISTAFIHKPDFNGVMWGTVNVLGNKISYENGTGKAREVSWISKDNGNSGSGSLLPKECANLFSSSPKASKQKLPWNPKMYHKAHCLIVRDMCCAVLIIWEQHSRAQKCEKICYSLGCKMHCHWVQENYSWGRNKRNSNSRI